MKAKERKEIRGHVESDLRQQPRKQALPTAPQANP
jgi:hypothetical protein